MTAKQLADRIARNAWNWGLAEFCRRTGFEAATGYAQEKFGQFQDLAKLLNRFDAHVLSILASEPEPTTAEPTTAEIVNTMQPGEVVGLIKRREK